MVLARLDRIVIEVDGITCFWESSSDIGTAITSGESGINPTTGATIKTPGIAEPKPLSLTKIYDPTLDKEFVDLLLDITPNAVLRSGNTKATLIYFGDANAIAAKFILSGLLLSSYNVPGVNGLSKSFAKLQCDFEVGSIVQA